MMTTAGDARQDGNIPSTASERDALAAEIRHEREELGKTMAALANKADVKERVSEGAAKAKEKVAEGASKTKEAVAETAGKAADKTAGMAHKAADKTSVAAHKAADKTAEVSKDMAAEVRGAAEGLADIAGKGVERVRRNPLPAIAAALAAIVAILAIRRKQRR